MTDFQERFWSKVTKGETCWNWNGAKDGEGYGQLGIEGRSRRAHRTSWELTVGPIPDGLVIDHLCRNTSCVNPDHLEPVTRRENTLRGIGPSAMSARSTNCPQGHDWTPDNTYITADGSRRCRTCQREHRRKADRKAYWKKKVQS